VDEEVPSSVTKKFDQAVSLIDQTATSPEKKIRKLFKGAAKALKQAKAKGNRAAKGKQPKISSDCAAVLAGAADGVAAGLPL